MSNNFSDTLSIDSLGRVLGERLAKFLDNSFTTAFAISTFGASLCFTALLTDTPDPLNRPGSSVRHIRRPFAVSLPFWVLDLAFTSFSADALSLWQPKLIQNFCTEHNQERTEVMWYATEVSGTLFTLLVIAFLTQGLIILAYIRPVGELQSSPPDFSAYSCRAQWAGRL
ncbi:hypothetical protein B0O99DRAFT_353318 [Bisporella sp. PMI_857]|nr:hypothetical protein B0O99DRAFT_353318 [Bisporella sp. PMI_857]